MNKYEVWKLLDEKGLLFIARRWEEKGLNLKRSPGPRKAILASRGPESIFAGVDSTKYEYIYKIVNEYT